MTVNNTTLGARSVACAILLAAAIAGLPACEGAEPLAPEPVNSTQVLATVSGSVPEQPTRPFQATLSGTMHIVGICAEGAGVVALMNGRGTASHLGQVTMTSDPTCVSLGQADWEVRLTGIMEAANGDQIMVSLEPTGVTPDGWELWDGEIAGGTGRFVSATGEVRQRVRLTTMPNPPEPGLWIATMDGWIAY